MIELAATAANFWYGLSFLLMTIVVNVFTLVMCYRWNAHFIELLNELRLATEEMRNAAPTAARDGRGPKSFAARV